MTPLRLRIVSRVRASREEQRLGVFAFLVLEIDDLLRLHVTLRRTWEGRWTLAFPRQLDRDGHRFDLVHPIHATARARIESEVLRQLGIDASTTQSCLAIPSTAPAPNSQPPTHPDLQGAS